MVVVAVDAEQVKNPRQTQSRFRGKHIGQWQFSANAAQHGSTAYPQLKLLNADET